MPSSRDIKRRIKSVKSTQQITQAMNLVSASKLQRAKTKLEGTRPFFHETRKVIASIIKECKGVKHHFLENRPVKRTAIIVLSSDRGLCGGYNSNISKEALALIRGKENPVIISVGKKGREFLSSRTKAEIIDFTGISEKPAYEDARQIGSIVIDMFKKNEIEEVYLVYTVFKSIIAHEPNVLKLLPLDASDFNEETQTEGNSGGSVKAIMLYEPGEEEILDYIVPKYVNTLIFGALMEAAACSQGATMTAMDSATENAEEMVENYTLQYNRARQGYITQELIEIVSGANALE